MIIGILANFAGYECAMSCMRGVAVKRGVKIIDKVLIPAGAFIIASMIGDECQSYTEKQIEKASEQIKTAIAKTKDVSIDVDEVEEVINNVFENKKDGHVVERDENGKPIAGRYPIKEEEEEANGESKDA